MRADVIDFAWQTLMLVPEPDSAGNLTVSLSPDVSYELHRRHVPFIEAGDLCPHELLWRQYAMLTQRVLELTKILDAALHAADPRFAERDWRLFDAFQYVVKIAFDQLLYYSDLLATLIADRSVKVFACAEQDGIALDEYGLFHPDMSVFAALLGTNLASGAYALAPLASPAPKPLAVEHPRFSFGQPLRNTLRSPMGARMLEFAEAAGRIMRKRHGIPVLSVGCKELEALPPRELGKLGIRLLGFRRMSGMGQIHKAWRKQAEFEAALAANPRIHEITHWRGIDFGPLLLKVVRFLSERAEDILAAGDRVFRLLDGLRPELVVFQTMAPFYLHNAPIRWWCEQRGVPYACWMHGGYGANYSLAGYDIVDYRLSRRHIAYGQVIGDLIRDERCVLGRLGFASQTVDVGGSPYFDALYRDRKMPKAAKPLRRVTLAIGVSYAHNQFYFGYDRPRADYSLWREHLKILRTLVDFQDRYEIVLKDYPGSSRCSMWKRMLDDLGAKKIRYMSDECSFPDLLEQSDLNIFPWISTTFFQALYSAADVFVLESGDISDQTHQTLSGQVFLHDDIETFCEDLRQYLDAGHFCRLDKSAARGYFLDWGRRGQRAEQFAGVARRTINEAGSGHAGYRVA